MTLADVLKIKFPQANFLFDIIVQDEGQGPYIAQWNLPSSKPTQKDIDKWGEEVKAEYKSLQIDALRQSEYPLKEELVVALWERIVEGRNTATDAIQAHREAIKNKYPKGAKK